LKLIIETREDQEDIYDAMKAIEYCIRDKGHSLEEAMLLIDVYKKFQEALKCQ